MPSVDVPVDEAFRMRHRVATVLISILALTIAAELRAAKPAASKSVPPAPVGAKIDADAGDNEGPERLNERMRWFRGGRLGPDGEIPPDARNRALKQIDENIRRGILGAQPKTLTSDDSWSPVGPSPLLDQGSAFSGRVTAIAVHPTDPNTVYVGAAQGGVWKTTDHGGTWAPMTDTQASLAVGSIAIDPSNPNVVYVGTGEANNSCDSYFGAGILKSTDAGSTWTLIGETPLGVSRYRW